MTGEIPVLPDGEGTVRDAPPAFFANAAIALFLFELVVAAASSWWLAGEAMGVKEWVGGAMIIAASLFSGHLEPAEEGEGREAASFK